MGSVGTTVPATSTPAAPVFMTATVPTVLGAGPVQGPLILPYPGAKHAPPKFKGDYTQVKEFIKRYENICQQCHVTTQKDLCENVIQYCSSQVSALIEVLDSYNTHNWQQLKTDLLKYYDADRDSKRYTPRDLVRFVRDRKEKPIKTLSEWKRYTRKFTTIGGWLMTHKKISANDHATYLWKGMHRGLRDRIESRLIAKDPLRDRKSPYTPAEITAAVENCLQRDRFETNLAYSDSETSGGETDSTSDSSSDSESESDSESKDDRKSRHKSKHKKSTKTKSRSSRHKVRFEDSSDEDDDISSHKSRKRKVKSKKYKPKDSDSESESSSEEEVHKTKKKKSKPKTSGQIEDIVEHLSKLSIDDPSYALLYFQALKIDATVKDVFDKPRSQNNFAPSQAQRAPRPPERQFTLTYPNNIRLGPPRYICYGCGGNNHRLSACPEINALIEKGALTRDNMGRITLPGGVELRREGEETFVMAQKRLMSQQTLSTHYVKVVSEDDWESSEHEVYYIPAITSDVDSDEQEYLVYPAERTIKDRSGKRREVFDGVYPPTAKDHREVLKREHRQRKEERQSKENVPASARQTTRDTRKIVEEVNINSTSRIEEIPDEEVVTVSKPAEGRTQVQEDIRLIEPARVKPGPGAPPSREFIPSQVKKLEDVVRGREDIRPTPVSTQKPRYNANNDEDIVMDDLPAVRVKEKPKGSKGDNTTNAKPLNDKPKTLAPMTNREETKYAPRISELAAKTNSRVLID
ncbi:hypothetical protein C8R48DRAFT_768505 [Suillus tomentosus]|nr:hypothetical protein C8R48DRAFT_768505 [Suillus tomentosus]